MSALRTINGNLSDVEPGDHVVIQGGIQGPVTSVERRGARTIVVINEGRRYVFAEDRRAMIERRVRTS